MNILFQSLSPPFPISVSLSFSSCPPLFLSPLPSPLRLLSSSFLFLLPDFSRWNPLGTAERCYTRAPRSFFFIFFFSSFSSYSFFSSSSRPTRSDPFLVIRTPRTPLPPVLLRRTPRLGEAPNSKRANLNTADQVQKQWGHRRTTRDASKWSNNRGTCVPARAAPFFRGRELPTRLPQAVPTIVRVTLITASYLRFDAPVLSSGL